ncbi:MAG: nuclear transport factor 2 family protein [Bacteroidota bacterium]
MKIVFRTIIMTFCLIICVNILFGQDPRESEIIRLENIEREATMKGDSTLLFGKIWSNRMVVNTPANRVGMVEGTKMQLRTGNLAYLSFVRNIEKITFNEDIAMVMGEEIIKPQLHQQNAGKTVTRRFTNIWKYSNKQWQMIGRHATILKVE